MVLPTFLARVSVIGSGVGGLLEILLLRVRLRVLGLLDQWLLLRLLLDPVIYMYVIVQMSARSEMHEQVWY